MNGRMPVVDKRAPEARANKGAASLRRMTSNVAAQLFSLAASAIDRLVLVGILVRTWGPELFSDYVVIQSMAAMLTIVEAGLQIYFVNVEKAAFVADDVQAFRRFAAIHLALILAIVAATAAGFAVFIVAGGSAHLFHLSRLEASAARDVFVVYALGSLLTVLRSATTTIYTAAGDFAFVVTLTAIFLATNTLAAIVAVLAGAGPLTLAAIYLAVTGIGSVAYFAWDARRRYADLVAFPARPTRTELRELGVHLKWFSLQSIAPTIWLQTPILVFNAWRVSGEDIAAFLVVRTMVNLIRQSFQFAAIGAGLEIATLSHRGDFAGAWRLSAAVGRLTTTVSAVCVAGMLSFGAAITLLWTGRANLFSPSIAAWLLVPLMLVAPLQQPLALLQYANLSTGPGLQRLALILLTPLCCALGALSCGTLGTVIGLAVAEVAASWALLPLLALALAGFRRYCLDMLGAATATLTLCGIVGLGLTIAFPSVSLAAMAGKIGVWALTAAGPTIFLALPGTLRAALVGRVHRLAGVRSGL